MHMHLVDSPPLTDPIALRFRLSTVRTGAWLSLTMIAAILVYFALSWNAGNRPLLSVIALGLGSLSPVLLICKGAVERLVAGPWRETFFLTWSLSTITAALLLGALDPTTPSPLMVPLLMPMLFAGLSYPRRSAMICCGAAVFGYVAEALIVGQSWAYSGFFLMCLVWTALMCLWQARNRESQHIELECQRDELARVSRTDPLTEALNRRGFQEALDRQLADAVRTGRPLTLAVLDLDDFKTVNDRDGHAAGDELLCTTVRRVREVLRPMDAVGRVGGDEFAVLFGGLGEGDAEGVFSRLRSAFAGRVPVSVGHSCFPADGATAQELFSAADARLYAVKGQRGGDRGGARLQLSWATAFADAVDRRMNSTHRHSQTVADYAMAIARQMGWTDPQVATLRLAAILHDIGKVAVPDRILTKSGPLDQAEFAEVKRHTVLGAEMLSRIDGLGEVAGWVYHSHEHFDGGGYPEGLSGEDIPTASRVLLVADAFDAMTSHRAYRQALGVDVAFAELRRHAGTQFDPQCVSALIEAGITCDVPKGSVVAVLAPAVRAPDTKPLLAAEAQCHPPGGPRPSIACGRRG